MLDELQLCLTTKDLQPAWHLKSAGNEADLQQHGQQIRVGLSRHFGLETAMWLWQTPTSLKLGWTGVAQKLGWTGVAQCSGLKKLMSGFACNHTKSVLADLPR